APMRVAVHLVVTTCHGAPVEKELGPVCVGVLDRVVVEVLVDVLASVMASAAGLGFDRPGTFHPGTLVDLMNVKVAVTTAAGPEETMEASDLPVKLGHRRPARVRSFRAGESRGHWTVHSIGAQSDEIAN